MMKTIRNIRQIYEVLRIPNFLPLFLDEVNGNIVGGLQTLKPTMNDWVKSVKNLEIHNDITDFISWKPKKGLK